MQVIYAVLSAVSGYLYFKVTTTPGSRINRKVPYLKLKNVQLLPSCKITFRGRVIHLHHWVYLTLLTCISFAGSGWFDSWITRGFMMGGALQGLRFPDRGIFKKISE